MYLFSQFANEKMAGTVSRAPFILSIKTNHAVCVTYAALKDSLLDSYDA